MLGDLDTYAISHFMPMAPEVYFRLFIRQNLAAWPSQLLTMTLGILLFALAWRRSSRYPLGLLAGLVLGGSWIWVGWTFHLQLYSELNWAATYFGWSFIAQGGLLLLWGLRNRSALMAAPVGASQILGAVLTLFALAVYPLLGPMSGRSWQAIELFGTAPDPTALATLGLLLLPRRTSWLLGVIPVLWCLYSGATWWAMDWPAGLVMSLAALLFMGAGCGRILARRTGRT